MLRFFWWLAGLGAYLWALPVHSQIRLEGTAIDTAGNPLPFVLVQYQDQSIQTDTGGKYLLTVQAGEGLLKASLLGYEQVEMPLSVLRDTTVNIQLSEKATELHEVVVTATRTSRGLADIPVPVTVITHDQIARTGTNRISELLAEFTGLQVVPDHGQGLQLQGLSSEYIMILVDGEPLIGRTAGTLDLSRIPVNNIERIEILKGPASALYGSEAMAGVVNIITRRGVTGLGWNGGLRTSSNHTWNVNQSLAWSNDRWNTSLDVNGFKTAGYDLDPETIAPTAPPYEALSLNGKVRYKLFDQLSIGLGSRYYVEKQEYFNDVLVSSSPVRMVQKGNREDWALRPTLDYHISDKHRLRVNGYLTGFQTLSTLVRKDDQSTHYSSAFSQNFSRIESQYDGLLSAAHQFTIGAGYTREAVEAARYKVGVPFQSFYTFAQYQFIPTEKWNLIIGARFDTHNAYQNRLSPKLSLSYSPTPAWSIQASLGSGYKAPDFRQLLLDFTNPVVGYSVVGNLTAKDRLRALQEEGQITTMLIPQDRLIPLQAESSWAYQVGFSWSHFSVWQVNLQGFRHDIQNLIDTAPIATKTNGQQVFSYFNQQAVVSQGIELDVRYRPFTRWTFMAGYQLLDTQNKEDVEQIRKGEVFRRNPSTNRTEVVSLRDYRGLPNRSRHSGNLKVQYQDENLEATARALYRGAWGVGDFNGNGIVDTQEEMAEGYVLLNLHAGYWVWKWLKAEAGIQNLTNVTHPFNPSLPGRIVYGGLQFKLSSYQNQ